MEQINYFQKMYSIDVSKWVEKKNGLSYVSWANAWGEIKKQHPDATYTIYENKDGWNYHTDGRTCWVKTGMTVNGIEHIEYLPVMDYRNASISADKVTSFDVNKAIQRSLTKAAARHGLGLYIYAGEDLPEGEADKPAEEKPMPDNEARIQNLLDHHKIQRPEFDAILRKLIDKGTVQDIPIADHSPQNWGAVLSLVHGELVKKK